MLVSTFTQPSIWQTANAMAPSAIPRSHGSLFEAGPGPSALWLLLALRGSVTGSLREVRRLPPGRARAKWGGSVHPRRPALSTTTTKVRPHVGGWRASNHPGQKSGPRVAVVRERPRKREKARNKEPPRTVELLAQAEEFPRLLHSGEVHSRAELAHRFRISAMWVTDILRLLKLHPPIQEAVRGLGPETPPRLVCERKLRGVAELPADEQLRAAAEFVPV